MKVNCTIHGEDVVGKVVCVYVRSTETPGMVEMATVNSDGTPDFSFKFDGKELIKAIENAMNV